MHLLRPTSSVLHGTNGGLSKVAICKWTDRWWDKMPFENLGHHTQGVMSHSMYNQKKKKCTTHWKILVGELRTAGGLNTKHFLCLMTRERSCAVDSTCVRRACVTNKGVPVLCTFTWDLWSSTTGGGRKLPSGAKHLLFQTKVNSR